MKTFGMERDRTRERLGARLREQQKKVWATGRCKILHNFKVVRGGKLKAVVGRPYAIVQTYSVGGKHFLKPSKRDPHWCRLIFGEPARDQPWMMTAVHDAFMAAMDNIADVGEVDADDERANVIVEINVPTSQGSRKTHTLNAIKMNQFNIEALAVNIDWLINFVASEKDPGAQHTPKKIGKLELADDEWKTEDTLTAWICSNIISANTRGVAVVWNTLQNRVESADYVCTYVRMRYVRTYVCTYVFISSAYSMTVITQLQVGQDRFKSGIVVHTYVRTYPSQTNTCPSQPKSVSSQYQVSPSSPSLSQASTKSGQVNRGSCKVSPKSGEVRPKPTLIISKSA